MNFLKLIDPLMLIILIKHLCEKGGRLVSTLPRRNQDIQQFRLIVPIANEETKRGE